MIVLACRAARSAVISLRESRSFVVCRTDKRHVGAAHSCTPERLR